MRRGSIIPAIRALQPPPYYYDGIHLDFRYGAGALGCYVKAINGAVTRSPLTSLFTFTGGAESMYMGPAGLLVQSVTNTPRIEYAANGNCLGLLMEASRTNLMVRSQALATSPWFNSNLTSIANNTTDVTDPAGGNNATKIVSPGGAAGVGCGATLTAVVHTGSIWLRCATGTVATDLIVYLSGSPFTSIGSASHTITTTWQRFTVVTSAATAASYNLQLNGIGAGTVYAYGAQLEAGAFASSYIPTTTVSVARTADSCIRTLGSEFSATAGTVVVAGRASGGQDPGNQHLYSFDNATNAEAYRAYRNGATDTVVSLVTDGGVTQAQIATDSFTNSTAFKLAVALQVNDYAYSFNGGAVSTDVILTMPTPTQLTLAGTGFNVTPMNGHIRRFDYYPTRLPNGFLTSA